MSIFGLSGLGLGGLGAAACQHQAQQQGFDPRFSGQHYEAQRQQAALRAAMDAQQQGRDRFDGVTIEGECEAVEETLLIESEKQ